MNGPGYPEIERDLLFVLVGASVVKIAATAFFGVALASDAITARAARSEIEEYESLFASVLARLADFDKRGLNVIECLLADHRNVDSLQQFPFVAENAVIKRVTEKVADG